LPAKTKDFKVMKHAVLLTSIPSPYMVELIDAVNAAGRWNIMPLYERYSSKGRRWNISAVKHDYIVLKENGPRASEKIISESDLVVIGTLWGKNSNTVLRYQKKYSKPLVFWGERPGAVWRNFVANAIRPLLLSQRFGHVKAVWGIGEWAVEEYRRCLPSVKMFANMPYASNLSPYLNILRKENNKPHSQPVRILYSGALIHRKGVDLLISAFIKLLNEGVQATLTMMGHGELETKLKTMVPERLKDCINFLGFKEWHELPIVYAEHDLLVAPSRYDGWGLIVVEGLAAGMPVIATNMMGSAIDFLKHGKNGWMTSAGDGKSLYSALKEALSALLLEMGKTARKSVECWTLDKAAQRWCDLADAVL
jgi:glycosyltransferase involved in cell wall biosynthesis